MKKKVKGVSKEKIRDFVRKHVFVPNDDGSQKSLREMLGDIYATTDEKGCTLFTVEEMNEIEDMILVFDPECQGAYLNDLVQMIIHQNGSNRLSVELKEFGTLNRFFQFIKACDIMGFETSISPYWGLSRDGNAFCQINVNITPKLENTTNK